jgi:hypothetical protein
MSVNLSPLAGAGWQLFDNNGVPLAGGKLETYIAGTSTPAATYTTSAGSIANSNPIVLDAFGRVPEEIWLTTGVVYKFVLRDASNVLIWTKDNISGINDITNAFADLSNTTDVAKGDALVGFKQANSSGVLTGAVGKTVHDKFQDAISVFDFMTPAQVAAVRAGTSTEDLSAAFQNAINTSNMVRVPKGTYLVNVIINSKIILLGDGSQSSIVKPYNDAIAAMTYTFAAQQTPQYAFWDYHSEVHGIGFWGKTAKVGIGFTFGTTVPANYTTNMEYANNVKFFGCRFYQLEKGIQFPFGNIGTEFYSCGFSSNKYGAYLLDNKFPAGSPNTMHAGNKYWYAGEFSGNECAVYVNNVTDGFGAIAWRDTIFEYNQCAGYFYNEPRPFIPISWDGCWFEGNGSISSGAATITISTWTGAVEGTQTLNKKTLIFDGTSGMYDLTKSFFGDVRLKGTNIAVVTENCRTEVSAGFGGGSVDVDNPANSYVRCVSPYSDNGYPHDGSTVVVGYPQHFDMTIGPTPIPAGQRWFFTKNRSSKVKNFARGSTGSGVSAGLKTSLSFTSVPYNATGVANVQGGLDGSSILYNYSSSFEQAAFASNQFLKINSPSSDFTMSEGGYYLVTVDWQRVTGNPQMYVWDRNQNQFIVAVSLPEANRWYTVAAIGYNAGNGATLFLDFSGGATTETCKWRIGGYQVLYFSYLSDAQNYLESGVFAENQNTLVIPSAATIYPPQEMDTVLISGTTGITSIFAGLNEGRRVTLIFQDILTVTDGGNLKLNGNFVSAANATLTVTCDGTNWYEVSRSAN